MENETKGWKISFCEKETQTLEENMECPITQRFIWMQYVVVIL
jgi:hypothetical protein